MSHIYLKDPIFEEELFGISTQGRDIRGQTTFKLKEEYLSWFDATIFYNPECHSDIYKTYEYFKKDKRLNIVVGDYNDNYKYATNVNQTIMKNLAKSHLVQIVVFLINRWLEEKFKIQKLR